MKLLLERLLSYFPSKLPAGMSQFDSWAESIIRQVGPIADNTSLRFVLASELMHSDAKKGSLPKNYFISRLQKLAANQVAGQVLTDIKEKQKAAQEAAAKQAEVTAAPTEAVTPDVQIKN